MRVFSAVVLGGYLCCSVLFLENTSYAQGLGKNGRWLTFNGEHVFFVGADSQELAVDRTRNNFIQVLDKFRQYRINKVRIWADNWFCDPTMCARPWVYDSTAQKYDLDLWNSVYWQQMREFIEAARAREMVVEISIFAPYPADGNGWWTSPNFKQAWNKSYNKNGAFSSNASGHIYPQFYDLSYSERSTSGKTIKDYQQAMIDKTVTELGSYDNVFFEIANEFPATDFSSVDAVYSWQVYWINYLSQKTSRYISVQVQDYTGTNNSYGIQYYWNEPALDMMTFHFYTGDPSLVSRELHAAQLKGKILHSNESFWWYDDDANAHPSDPGTQHLDADTREQWGFFTSGGYYAFYNAHRFITTPSWLAMATRAKTLHDIADKVRFWEMSPVDQAGNEYDNLVSQGPAGANHQVLANPGSQYVVYFWGTPEATNTRIQLPSGNYDYQWYETGNGGSRGTGSVTGGTTVTIPSPSASSWNGSIGLALLILRQATTVCGNAIPEAGETCSSCPADIGFCLPTELKYTLDTSSINGSTVLDAFGHHNATLSGPTIDTNGVFAQALALDGSNDHVALPSLSFASQSFSVSIWIKPNGPAAAAEQILFGAHSAAAVRKSLHLRLNSDGSVTFGFWGDDLTSPAGKVTFNEWNLVTFVYNASSDSAEIFVNGQNAATGNVGPFEGTKPVCYIGRWMDGYEEYYEGLIDDFRLFNTALTQSSVAAIYAAGAQRTPVSPRELRVRQ